ncbi:DUF2334 domain-containing protein [Psychrobacter sp. CAL346-MNA-CIBAN-0220]|uniref:DUF2334 domain-containing protein n=1 Tax=Psychrobacter sp. CAL346-MNA-CIBAN-0220 TaxID=3140457 RepID=UPI00331A95BF
MSKYLMRFDDITADMDWDKFLSIKKVLEKYNIYSVLGVVPNNEDPVLKIKPSLSEEQFFLKVKEYKEYGDTIAQHGTHHTLQKTKSFGLLDIGVWSEFSERSYDEQLSNLSIGKKILEKYEVWQPYFMAPYHTFDINTLKALKSLDFKAITDGYGFYPYQVEGITFVPQLVTNPVRLIPFGIQTFCIHTNNMDQASLDSLISFINKNHNSFISFEEALDIEVPNKYFKSVTYKTSKELIKFSRKIRGLS